MYLTSNCTNLWQYQITTLPESLLLLDAATRWTLGPIRPLQRGMTICNSTRSMRRYSVHQTLKGGTLGFDCNTKPTTCICNDMPLHLATSSETVSPTGATLRPNHNSQLRNTRLLMFTKPPAELWKLLDDISPVMPEDKSFAKL